MVRGKKCYFCTNRAFPSYKDIDVLSKFVSERGKISSRLKSGVCNRHQTKLTREIKRARFLALMPYVTRPFS